MEQQLDAEKWEEKLITNNSDKAFSQAIISGALNPQKGLVRIVGGEGSGRSTIMNKTVQYYQEIVDTLPANMRYETKVIDTFESAVDELNSPSIYGPKTLVFLRFPIYEEDGLARAMKAKKGWSIVYQRGVSNTQELTEVVGTETLFMNDIGYSDEEVSTLILEEVKKHWARNKTQSKPTFLKPQYVKSNLVEPVLEGTMHGPEGDQFCLLPPGYIVAVAQEWLTTMHFNREHPDVVAHNAVQKIYDSPNSLCMNPDEDNMGDSLGNLLQNIMGGNNPGVQKVVIARHDAINTDVENSLQEEKSDEHVDPPVLRNPDELNSILKSGVVGQDVAIDSITEMLVKPYVLPIGQSSRPVFVTLLSGPTGVGKTETAKLLAQHAYDKEVPLIRIDCSEYKEQHEVSKLYGAPPGYVGYGEGGQLTNAVAQNPYSVVLLDEVEKAHPSMWDAFLQVFDDGHLTDGSGERISFENTMIILTSNLGTESLSRTPLGFVASGAESDRLHSTVREALRNFFRPELLNRLDKVVTYEMLSDDAFEEIVAIKAQQVIDRFEDNRIRVRMNRKQLADFMLSQLQVREYGAREMSRLLDSLVSAPIARFVMEAGRKSSNSYVYLEADFSTGETVVSKTGCFRKEPLDESK